jgi:hypothetical protein
MSRAKAKIKHKNSVWQLMHKIKADSLTGFIAGFLVGVIGMYVYAVIITNMT